MPLKKFKVLVLLAIVLSMGSALFAEDPAAMRKLAGGGTVGNENIENLSSTGVLKLNGSTIQKLQVHGSLIATAASLGTLNVFGEANLRDTTVTEPCLIFGSLRAQETTFHCPLILNTHKAVFTASKLNSITIRKEEGFKGKQIIELKQGTIVDGPITFESGKGEVHSYNSQVLSPITGGKLIKKS